MSFLPPNQQRQSTEGNIYIARTRARVHTHTHTHTHTFNGPFSRTTLVSRYQKGKTNLDITEARDSEWQRHQLGHMQVCTLLQTDNHTSTPPLSFLQARCPSCHPTNSVKALQARNIYSTKIKNRSRAQRRTIQQSIHRAADTMGCGQ